MVRPPYYDDHAEIMGFNAYAHHQAVLDNYIQRLFADCELAFWVGQNWQSITHIDGERVTEDDLVYIIRAIREG